MTYIKYLHLSFHSILLFFVCVAASLCAGCRVVHPLFDEHFPIPEQTAESFQSDVSYSSGNEPGITVRADFSKHHISGQPYGFWTLKVSWYNVETRITNATTTPIVIDELGKGIATISYDFLNQLLAQCSDKPTAYVAEPGLILDFLPASDTWDFYTFTR